MGIRDRLLAGHPETLVASCYKPGLDNTQRMLVKQLWPDNGTGHLSRCLHISKCVALGRARIIFEK